MSEATSIADSVRRDLKLLSTRTAALGADQPCQRCGRALALPPPPCGLPSGENMVWWMRKCVQAMRFLAGGAIQPFFVFPTGSAYHGVCCAAEVIAVANAQQQNKIRGLMASLSRATRPSAGDTELQVSSNSIYAQLELIISSHFLALLRASKNSSFLRLHARIRGAERSLSGLPTCLS